MGCALQAAWLLLSLAACFAGTTSNEVLNLQYHISRRNGWLNDPNGLIWYKGVYHVFFQATPGLQATPGAISWAHAVSTDLAHWRLLPLALTVGPRGSVDEDGVFSGSITLNSEGQPRLLYTCTSRRAELGFFYQQQCGAVPEDAADPYLTRWRKTGLLNMTLPPGGSHAQWRDPAAGVRDGPNAPWRVIIGAQVNCRGAAVQYTSSDLVNWSYSGLFYAQPASSFHAGYCSQFGESPGGGAMWEMPSTFQLGSVSVFLFGDQRVNRSQWQVSFYLLGSRAANSSFVPFTSPLRLDGGDIYAAQTMLDPPTGRRLMWAWAEETPPTAARGWQGVITLPRVLSLSNDGRRLLQHPPQELALLRTPSAPVFTAYGFPLNASAWQLPLPRSPSRGRAYEVLLELPCAGGCTGSVYITTTGAGVAGQRTVIRLSAAKGAGVLDVDRWNTGGVGDARPQTASLQEASSLMRLHLFLDHSICESFAGGAVVTTRLYPAADLQDWGLAVSGGGGLASVQVWEMGRAGIEE